MMRRPFITIALGLAALAGPATIALAQQSATGPTPLAKPSGNPPAAPLSPAVQQRRIADLLKIILQTLRKAPASQNVQTLAGQLSLQISQSESDCSVTQAALRQAAASNLTRTARRALQQVTAATARCQNTGTGALPNAQTVASQGTSLGLGGGTSNYVAP